MADVDTRALKAEAALIAVRLERYVRMPTRTTERALGIAVTDALRKHREYAQFSEFAKSWVERDGSGP